MSNKKEKSAEILEMIENFKKEFGEQYNIYKSTACVYGIPLDALTVNRHTVNNLLTAKVDISGDFTFAIIKPNSVENKDSVNIIADIEAAGLTIYAANTKEFTREEAEEFYEEHKGKYFIDSLIDFMTSGPVITLLLEKKVEDGVGLTIERTAIKTFRDLMGPVEAVSDKTGHPNTLRANYAESMTKNSVHGSDSKESFNREIKFF